MCCQSERSASALRASAPARSARRPCVVVTRNTRSARRASKFFAGRSFLFPRTFFPFRQTKILISDRVCVGCSLVCVVLGAFDVFCVVCLCACCVRFSLRKKYLFLTKCTSLAVSRSRHARLCLAGNASYFFSFRFCFALFLRRLLLLFCMYRWQRRPRGVPRLQTWSVPPRQLLPLLSCAGPRGHVAHYDSVLPRFSVSDSCSLVDPVLKTTVIVARSSDVVVVRDRRADIITAPKPKRTIFVAPAFFRQVMIPCNTAPLLRLKTTRFVVVCVRCSSGW